MKNFFWKLFVQIFPKKKIKSQVPTRILVVTTTALGDTLWAMPGIESLRLSFPKAYLVALTSPIGEEILAGNPWTDKIYRISPFFSLLKLLKKERFDTILIFHSSQRFIVPLLKILSPQRLIGTKGLNKGLDDLLTDALPPLPQHEIERRLAMVKKIGGQRHSHELSFFLTPEEKKEKLKGKPQIAIHPGSKDSYKLWPLEHFAKVGRALQEKWDCEILITGGPSELNLMQNLSRLIPGSSIVDPHQCLRSFASFLNGVDLLISNDTGPFHLACALKRAAIGIYSPTDPLICGPLGKSSGTVLYKRKSCTPCLRRQCKEPFCLLQISPDEVIQRASIKWGSIDF